MEAVAVWLSVMASKDLPRVCVVTQPIGETDPTATADLLSILSSLTAVSLVTIALPDDSRLWSEYEIDEVRELPMGASIPVAAVRFVRNQFRMARVIR
jgi:ABC-type antimicrobial peptide transport system ATPase subunit